IRNLAIIEPDWDEPLGARSTLPQLLNREEELLILVALSPAGTGLGKAGDEDQRIVGYGLADLEAPVFSRPQAFCVAPHRDPGRFQHLLELVDPIAVFANIGDEREARRHW